MDQLARIETSEINSLYGQFNDKEDKTIQWRKESLQQIVLRKLKKPHAKE